MSKEEIKNLLIDFVCEYDFTNWNNDKIYEKFSDLIYKQISDLEAKLAESEEQLLKFLHRISEQNEEIEDMKDHQKDLCLRCGGLSHKKYEHAKIDFAIEQLEKLANNSVILEGMFLEGGHYLHQKRYNVVGKGDIENLIKELKEGK